MDISFQIKNNTWQIQEMSIDKLMEEMQPVLFEKNSFEYQ